MKSIKSAFRALLKSPLVIIGTITALIFQILFSLIWLTGYDHITNNVNRFAIAIVNDDQEIGTTAVQTMMTKLPFVMKQENNLDHAMSELDERKLQMVVHIPNNFTQSIKNPSQKAVITYSMNESNPTMVKSVMQTVVHQISASLNEQAVQSGITSVLEQAHIPNSQALQLSQSMSSRIDADLNYIHPIANFSHTMVPMMLVLASFTGCMLFVMEVNKAAKLIRQLYNRWTLFAARSLLNIATSLLITTVSTVMVTLMGVHSKQGFAIMWMFQLVYVITFLFVAQLSFYIFSDAGGWINIALLSMQLITSGAMVPRELLPTFYQFISDYFPATFAVVGIMNLVNGGPASSSATLSLLLILLSVLVITTLIVGGTQLLQRKPKETIQMAS
ncbi:ABC transporter permease [Paenibacillus sp. D2_2]|uniref:YhgE/Pip domain-containing protein n=1 Tax=Paenibacillus sp. D2_2 TaxID=3073092 RepID=UPI002815206F|nr:ABC transporter permease [Paenibacillus sp. D2_2]WMT42455.1 ABC transporter permease [Paenibacillus sp. D2_2]